MTVTKNRDTTSGINIPTILGFAESFIDSCDPELNFADLTEVFTGPLLITEQYYRGGKKDSIFFFINILNT